MMQEFQDDGTGVVEISDTLHVENLACVDATVEPIAKKIDVAYTLSATEYKGVRDQGSNIVVEKKQTDSCE